MGLGSKFVPLLTITGGKRHVLTNLGSRRGEIAGQVIEFGGLERMKWMEGALKGLAGAGRSEKLRWAPQAT